MPTIQSKALHRALSIVAPAVNARAVIPILVNVKFAGGYVTANDLQLEIRTKSGLPDDFNCIAPFDELRALMGVLNEEVKLTANAGFLTVTASKGKWKLALPADVTNWPASETVPSEMQEVPEGLTDAIFNASRMLASTESVVPFYMNISLCNRGGKFSVAGSNNNKFYQEPFATGPAVEALMPPTIVRALSGMQPTSYAVGEKMAWFSDADTTISVRLAEGKIPNIGLFARNAPANITCSRVYLIAAIQQATVLKRNVTNSLHVTFAADSISVAYRSLDGVNDAAVTIPATCGEVGRIELNAGFTLEVLGCLSSDEIGILYAGPTKHIYFIDTDKPDVLALVMPLVETGS